LGETGDRGEKRVSYDPVETRATAEDRHAGMAKAGDTILERLRHQRALAGWQHRTDRVAGIGPARLDMLRGRAVEMRRQIDRFVWAADARLERAPALPAGHAMPLGTDWVWRPAPWAGRLAVPGLASVATGSALGEGLLLFHDCPLAEIGLRQRHDPGDRDLPPFCVEVEVFGFGGSFLSLALDLPPEAAQGLRPRHLIRLETVVDCERPLGLFARLNLQQGPNVVQILRQVSVERGTWMVEFDPTPTPAAPVEKLWLDLIFGAPAMNRISLRDLRLSRHPRAAL
jgi:hypothetical protein